MRTVKFRGRCDKDSLYAGEWVEGSLVQCEDGTALIVVVPSDNCKTIYRVEPDTVCQFTGVKDSKGNELYEHDLVALSPFVESLEISWGAAYGAFGVNYNGRLQMTLEHLTSRPFTKVGDIF